MGLVALEGKLRGSTTAVKAIGLQAPAAVMEQGSVPSATIAGVQRHLDVSEFSPDKCNPAVPSRLSMPLQCPPWVVER